jgi:8-oxo-dGTP diphosphatase
MSKLVIKIKNNNFKSAHVVIVKDDKILIVRRSQTDEWMPGHYGLPGGKLDENETPTEALSRECKEEVNLDILPKNLIFLPKNSNNKEHAFFYTTKFNGELKLDFEHDDFQWVNPKNLSKYKVVPDLPDIIKEVLEALM